MKINIGLSNTKYVYRIVDIEEWIYALKIGFLIPSKFYGRIHASFSPEPQYGKRGDFVLQIDYDVSDGWQKKQGDKEYLVTDKSIPINKIKPISRIGFHSVKVLDYPIDNSEVSTVVGEVIYRSGWQAELDSIFPKIQTAKYISLFDDSGILVSYISFNDETWFVYRSKNGFSYTDHPYKMLNDLRNNSSNISVFGKFMRNTNLV